MKTKRTRTQKKMFKNRTRTSKRKSPCGKMLAIAITAEFLKDILRKE